MSILACSSSKAEFYLYGFLRITGYVAEIPIPYTFEIFAL